MGMMISDSLYMGVCREKVNRDFVLHLKEWKNLGVVLNDVFSVFLRHVTLFVHSNGKTCASRMIRFPHRYETLELCSLSQAFLASHLSVRVCVSKFRLISLPSPWRHTSKNFGIFSWNNYLQSTTNVYFFHQENVANIKGSVSQLMQLERE